MTRTFLAGAALLLLTLSAAARGAPPPAGPPDGERGARLGEPVPDAELPALGGRDEHVLAPGAKATVLVFFRPGQERSADTLAQLADSEAAFAGKPVRFVAIAPGASSLSELRAVAAAARVRMPILLDVGDALYGRLGVRLHPLVAVLDGAGRLAAWEPFREINQRARIDVRVRWLLGEAAEAEIASVDAPARSETGPTDEGRAKGHLNFARRLLAIGDRDAALAEVRKALALAPSAGAYALEGEVLAALGRCPDARRAFDAARRLAPGATIAQVQRASCGG